jgi:hypothetical protein
VVFLQYQLLGALEFPCFTVGVIKGFLLKELPIRSRCNVARVWVSGQLWQVVMMVGNPSQMQIAARPLLMFLDSPLGLLR